MRAAQSDLTKVNAQNDFPAQTVSGEPKKERNRPHGLYTYQEELPWAKNRSSLKSKEIKVQLFNS